MNFLCRLLFLLLPCLLIACQPEKTENAPVDQALPAALILTTDYQSGSFATADALSLAVHTDIDHIYQDSICRVDTSSHQVFIVQRFGSDAIAIVDPHRGWQITHEYSVGPGTNPQDIAIISNEKAYVSRLVEPDLLIIHPITGEPRGRIDLSMLADADGIPEASWMAARGDRVFVSVLQLDSRNGYIPGPTSQIAVINSQTDQVVKVLETARANPAARIRFSSGLNQFVLVESGIWSTIHSDASLDGAIEYLDPETETLSGPIIFEEDLEGDLVDAVILSSTLGFAIVGTTDSDGPVTRLVSFNPQERRVESTLLVSESWALSDLALSPDDRFLWVTDRSPFAPGIRVFDIETEAPITEEPIDLGLPPQMICFVPAD